MHTIDYIIFLAYLGIVLGVGVFARRRDTNGGDYFAVVNLLLTLGLCLLFSLRKGLRQRNSRATGTGTRKPEGKARAEQLHSSEVEFFAFLH